jgi:hypothetical protein
MKKVLDFKTQLEYTTSMLSKTVSCVAIHLLPQSRGWKSARPQFTYSIENDTRGFGKRS